MTLTQALLSVLLLAMAMGCGLIIWLLFRRRAKPAVTLEAKLSTLRQRLWRLLERIPQKKSLAHTEFPPIDGAAAVEAWLLSDLPKNALMAALELVKRDPEDGDAYLHLARALIHCNEADSASRALVRSRTLGSNTPAHDYLEGRIRLLTASGTVTKGPLEPSEVITIFELFLGAAEEDPSFGDAAYHAGLLALALGMRDEARTVLLRVEPLMEASPDRARYERDVAKLN